MASPTNIGLVLLASEWGSKHGEVSTFNRELAIQFAKQRDVQVSVFVLRCDQEEKNAALNENVTLVQATRMPGFAETDWLSYPPDDLRIDFIIGHGVELGRHAQVIKRNRKCKWMQFVHTDPEELGMFKDDLDAISKAEKRHQDEVDLCVMADCVVAVGPKLAEAYRSYLRSSGTDQDVFGFTPGIFREFLGVVQSKQDGSKCQVLAFGHGSAKDFSLKGFDIVAKAVAKLDDAQLIFVGAQTNQQGEIASRLKEYSIPPSRLKVRALKDIRKQFSEVDLAIMPSRAEGFGLVALEAMSAGLPVLVSGNSGFGKALNMVRFGSHYVISSEDADDWAEMIKKVWTKQRHLRLEESKSVCDSYAEKYKWEEQCKELVEKMRSTNTDHVPLRIDCQVAAKGIENESIPSAEEVLSFITLKYFRKNDPCDKEGRSDFLRYLEEIRKVLVVGDHVGSLIITVKCSSLQILRELWEDYCTGHLNDMAQQLLVTEEILKAFGQIEVKLITTIKDKDYRACKEYLMRQHVIPKRVPGSKGKRPAKESDVGDDMSEAIDHVESVSNDPPEVDRDQFTPLKAKDLPSPKDAKGLKDVQLPVDILLLTAKDCELLSCLSFLNDGFFNIFDKRLGYLFFGEMGKEERKLRIAVIQCNMGSSGPKGSIVVLTKAVNILGPKAVFCVGFCGGLNHKKVKLGDVVLSAKLRTYASVKITESGVQERGIGVPPKTLLADLIRGADFGWKAPLKEPAQLDVRVHKEGVFLSGPVVVDNDELRQDLIKRFPDAIAIEMEGEGVHTAAHDLDVEWIVIKGVSDYADGKKSATDSWRPFASQMAASLTAHILSNPMVFEDWPHHGCYAASLKRLRISSSSGTEDPIEAVMVVSPSKKRKLNSGAVKPGCPSEEDLQLLAKDLGDDWRSLASCLGFTRAEITAFHRENERLADKAKEMLLDWKKRNHIEATYQVLYDALCHKLVRNKELAEKFCRLT